MAIRRRTPIIERKLPRELSNTSLDRNVLRSVPTDFVLYEATVIRMTA